MAEFDEFASRYEEINDEHSWFFGESTSYFVKYKCDYIVNEVGEAFEGAILDFGCGIGLLSHSLAEALPRATIHGVDPAREALQIARQRGGGATYFGALDELSPEQRYDVILVVNVLHHVEPIARQRLIDDLAERLHENGRMIVLEHNPLNPLVMWTLRNHPFDSNAIFLHAREVERFLRRIGLATVREYIVFFPAFLSFLRRFERKLGWLPVGAQYTVVGRRGVSLGERRLDS